MTRNKSKTQHVKELENRLLGIELAFETSDDWLWDLDLENRTLTFLGDWYKRLGIKEQTDVGMEVVDRWIDRIHPDDQLQAIHTLQKVVNGQMNRIEVKYRILENTGDYFWVSTRVASRRNSEGELNRLVGVHSDTDIYHNSVERLQNLAYTDITTGINNRVALMDHINNRFTHYDTSQINGSVLLIGLDYFKFANTTYGRYVGDRILKTISESIANVPVDTSTFVARYESDQFCVVLNYLDDAQVLAYAERILSSISQTIHIEEDAFTITASIGIASFPLHGTSFEELLKNAESAMMAAKNSGKNTAIVYQYNMNQSLIEKWTLTQELHSAIDNNELQLVYQPIVSLTNNQIVGFETLVRWDSPKLGIIPPNRFIPLAEEIGIIELIDRWVFEHGVQFIKRISEKYKQPLYVSINISSTDLVKRTFIATVKETLERHEVLPSQVKIEITEHALMTSLEESKQMMLALKKLGIEVFLDDFGTGYSSFNYLKNLPVDLVKLDMSFISDILKDQQTERLIDGMIHLSHVLDLKICAEGIEDAAQESLLKLLNCDYGQGYLYAKPLEELELCQLIEKNSFQF